MKTHIAIINTGGTISCIGSPLQPMTATKFAEASKRIIEPILKQQFTDTEFHYVDDLKFPESTTGTLDSTNLQPSDWCLIAKKILSNYDKYDGWIVLHGTDSMAYTSSALSFLLSAFDDSGNQTISIDKSVVITGSQVPLFYKNKSNDKLMLNFNTDAYQNICAAVSMVQTRTPEVTVAFRGNIFRGSRVIKVNASDDNAFNSPNFPPLATMGVNFSLDTNLIESGPIDKRVSLSTISVQQRAKERIDYIYKNIDSYPVVPVSAFPAYFSLDGSRAFIADIIDSIVKSGAKGIILESYGEGNFPSGNPDSSENGAIAKILSKANAEGVIIINATQVIAGTVNDSAYAAGAWLPAAGAVGIGDMTPISALTKTMILLAESGWDGNNWNENTVKHLIGKSLLGESNITDRIEANKRSQLLPTESLVSFDGSATLLNDPDLGPILISEDGTKLWKVLSDDIKDTSGKLLANGRSISFIKHNGDIIWDTSKITKNSVYGLALNGSIKNNSLKVELIDSFGTSVSTLYP